MNSVQLLKKLSLTKGISGFETPVKKIFKEELANISDFQFDNLGSISVELSGHSDKPRILLVGHMDEVGFIVRDITKQGLLKFHPIGGWNPLTLLSAPVTVINKDKEELPGIISSIPTHFRKEAKSKVGIKDMFLDVGATSEEEVKKIFKIDIGAPVIPRSIYHYNKKTRRMISKAFDDRVGVAATIETAKKFQNQSHPNTLICAGSVQEEVGTRGAHTVAELTKPDIAIIVEGAPADDFPGNPNNPQTSLDNGAHLRLFDPSMLVKKELKDFVLNLAEEKNIKCQPTVRTGGGTDGKTIHLKKLGIPSIVLGVPVRYAHTHNCIMSMNDFDELLKLIEAIIQKLDKEALEKIVS